MAIGELGSPPSLGLERRAAAGVLGFALALVLVGMLAVLGVPLPIVAVGAAATLALGLLARPRAATLLFIGLLYTNAPVVADRFHGVPGVVAIGGPLLLLGIPILSYLVIRRGEPVMTATLYWIVAYLTVQLLSAATSNRPEAAASIVAAFASEGLILYVLLTNAVRDWRTVRGAITVLLVAGTIMGGLSLFQEFTGTYENQYWGFAQTRELDPLNPIDPDDTLRLSGPIGEKNRYAQVMLMLLPLGLMAFLTARSRTARILAVVASTAILGGMLLTFSRGAGVALAVLVLLAIVLRYVRLRDAVLVAVALAVAVFVFTPRYIDRVASLVGVGAVVSGSSSEVEGAIIGRATSNLASLNVFLDYPILGVGPGQYWTEFSQSYANDVGLRYFETARRAHSMPLEVAADTGILGLVTLGAVFGSTLWGLWRVRRMWLERHPEYAAWATAFMLSVLAYLLTSAFLHISYMRYLWLFLALANSVIWVLSREASTGEDPAPA